MRKGSKQTTEARKKISEALKGQVNVMRGKHHSEQSRKNMSLAHMGQVAWNKGIKVDRQKFSKMGHFQKFSEEQKRRISEATKLAMANPEIRRKISLGLKGKPSPKKGIRTGIPSAMKGKHHTEEARMKMKEAVNKRWLNHEYRKRMSEVQKERFAHSPSPRKGVRASLETLRKLSESHKGQISGMKGKHQTEETRAILRKSTEKAWSNPLIRKKLIEANRVRYDNPESLEKIRDHSRKTILRLYESGAFPRQTNTKPERQIKEELIKRGHKEGIDFIHQYKFMNKFMCDFCFPKQKLIIEVDGDFWHANPKKYPAGSLLHKHQIKDMGRDKSKSAYIMKVDNGTWTLLRFWESDIKKDVAKCVNKIKEVLAKKSKI